MKLFLSVLSAAALYIAASVFTVAQTPTPADVGADARKQEADAAFADAERNLTVRLIDKATSQADADTQLLGQVDTASKALVERLNAMKTNEEGKRLAAALDEISAEQIQHLIDQPPVMPEILAATKKEIDSTAADLKKLHDNPPAGFVLPDQQQDQLVKDAINLRQMLARLRERDEWLTTQVSAAPKSIDVSKAPTLEAALADFRVRQQQSWNAAQRKGIDEAKPEALEKVTESAKRAELERSLQGDITESRGWLAFE
jgi:hypothetical protein